MASQFLLHFSLLGEVLPEECEIICPGGTSALRDKLPEIGFAPEHIIKKPMNKWSRLAKTAIAKAWLFPSEIAKHVVEGEVEKLTAETASMALACRLFGGYIVDEEWLAAAAEVYKVTGQRLIPNICFEPAIKKERQAWRDPH